MNETHVGKFIKTLQEEKAEDSELGALIVLCHRFKLYDSVRVLELIERCDEFEKGTSFGLKRYYHEKKTEALRAVSKLQSPEVFKLIEEVFE